MAGLDPNQVIVAPTGRLYLAPEGTVGPADLAAAWASEWVDLGYLSEDAVTMSSDSESTEINAWQSDYPIWSNVVVGRTVGFQLMQWNEANLAFAFGGGTWTETGVAPDTIYTYTAPPASAFGVNALGLEVVDGPKVTRVVWHRVKITELGDVQFTGDAAALLDITVQLLANGEEAPFYMIGAVPAAVAGLAAPTPSARTSEAKVA